MAERIDENIPDEDFSPERTESHEQTRRHIDAETKTIFENGSCNNRILVKFLPFFGARGHHRRQRFDYDSDCFKTAIRNILEKIPPEEIDAYSVTLRIGIVHYTSNIFKFRRKIQICELEQLVSGAIPISNTTFYHEFDRGRPFQSTHLKSSFETIKPIDDNRIFANELARHNFHLTEVKHTFRIYLQTEDKVTYICTVEPDKNYSITEIVSDRTKLFHVDFISDRRKSGSSFNKCYEDVFDFRVQFRKTTRKFSNDEVIDELCRCFHIDRATFRNENIIQRVDDLGKGYDCYQLHQDLVRYCNYVRFDYGDSYVHRGNDDIFYGFVISLQTSIEYNVNRNNGILDLSIKACDLVSCHLDFKNLDKNIFSNIPKFSWKLWNMGKGLSSIAQSCSNPERSSLDAIHYYENVGRETYTAKDHTIIQRIYSESNLQLMLGFSENQVSDQILKQNYFRLIDHFANKWSLIPNGLKSKEKLENAYKAYVEK